MDACSSGAGAKFGNYVVTKSRSTKGLSLDRSASARRPSHPSRALLKPLRLLPKKTKGLQTPPGCGSCRLPLYKVGRHAIDLPSPPKVIQTHIHLTVVTLRPVTYTLSDGARRSGQYIRSQGCWQRAFGKLSSSINPLLPWPCNRLEKQLAPFDSSTMTRLPSLTLAPCTGLPFQAYG